MPRVLRRHISVKPLLVLALLLVMMSLPAGQNSPWNSLRTAASVTSFFSVNSTGDGADSNLGDGVCNDGTGACTLRAAIQQANALAGDDSINFHPVLNGSAITLNTALPDISSNLTITGPGSALLTIQRSTAGGTPNFRIFRINSSIVAISGLTVAKGLSSSSPGGGGIYNLTNSLTLTDVTVSGNETTSGGFGGGLYNSGTLILNNCTVSNSLTNAAPTDGFGGGIFNTGTLTLNNSNISSNQTGNGIGGGGFGGSGGGIYNQVGTLTLNNSTVNNNQTGSGNNNGAHGGGIANNGSLFLNNSHIDNNSAVGGGGGIYNIGSVVATGSTVSGNLNKNNGTAGDGGGIHNTVGATVNLTNCTINGNRTGNSTSGGAGGYGGGLFNLATMTVTGSTISNNQTGVGGMVGGYGGGIFNSFGNLTMVNSTVSGNQTGNAGNPEGGGIANYATLTLTNCTIRNNTALGFLGHGGGLNNVSGTITLSSTIVAGNFRVDSVTPDDISGSIVPSSSFNLIGIGGSGGLANGVNNNQVGVADPVLGPLANNGGPTFTHALLPGSPAIDAGSSTQPTDQRGQPRPIDDPNSPNAAGSDTSDIGAYEGHTFEVNSTADTTDGACTAIGTGNGCTLREAITAANAETGAELITFAPALTSGGPATISLLTALPALSSSLIIASPAPNLLTVERSHVGGTPAFRIFVVNSGTTVSLYGLTISNGIVTGINTRGGGLLNNGTLTMTNCNVYGNSAADIGGGGGGIFSDGVSLILNSCNIGGTGPGQPNSGGGIFHSGGANLPMANQGTLLMTAGTIAGNSGNPGYGIFNFAPATLKAVVISDNTGGGVRVGGNFPTNILNCLIVNNSDSTNGGSGGAGIYNFGTINVVNSTISGNISGGPGGGVFSFNATLTALTNVTVTNNRAGSSGGGIYNSGLVLLKNTIVAGNFSGTGPSTTADDIGFQVSASSSFNLIGTCNSCGLTNGVNNNQVGVTNPLLGPLANNGGPTMTHALLAGSSALDLGSNANVPPDSFDFDSDGNTSEPIPFDQRGTAFNRIVDGPDVDTADRVDIGAFEAQVSLPDIANQAINEDGSLSLPFNVGGSAFITSVTATSSNTTLVPNNPANILVSGGGSTRLLQVNPVANQFGTSTITVTVNGANSQSMVDTFVLTVNSVNDVPTDIALSNSSVAENSASGTLVGGFSSTDPDTGDTFTYSLVFGNGSVNNSSFTISGNQLLTNSIFDFEAKASYSVRVRSTDQNNGFFEEQFTIIVTDGLDNPGTISFSAANYNVGEGSGSAAIDLTRTGGADNQVIAKVTLADISTSPADYRFTPGAFDDAFNPGGSSATSGFVQTLALQPDGKIIIGGAFLFYNGTTRNRIARLNADGTLDATFNPGTGANDYVAAVALQPDGKIIIGGAFTIYNGQSRLRIARLNSDGSLDPTFAGLPDDVVRAILMQPDGKIIIGGDFFLYNGSSVNHVTRLNSDGSRDFSFNTGLGANAGVATLALQADGKLLIGGGFTNFGSASNTRLLRVNSDGTHDASFNSAIGLSMAPRQIVLQSDGKLLVGGEWVGNDTPLGKRSIVRLNANGSEDVSFTSGVGTNGHIVAAVALQPDAKIIIAGQFASYDGTPITRIARLNNNGVLDNTFNPGTGPNFPVFGVALQPDGKIVICGQYNFYNDISSNGITRILGDFFVTWLQGDASNKTITLPIVDDSLNEGNETASLTLSLLSGGATTGTNPATLTIVDNDLVVTSVSGSGPYGGTATLTARLMSGAAGVSGKLVDFSLNNVAVGSAATGADGIATLSNVGISGIGVGTYPGAVGASFAGDGSFGSGSGTGPLTVSQAATATGVTSSANPSDFGQSVTFTATVTSSGGVPTGTVQFRDGPDALGSAVACTAGVGNSCTAQASVSTLGTGTHTISATYSGDASFMGSVGTLANGQVVRTPPAFSIDDVATSEGDSGAKTANFTVTLSAASNLQVKVDYATADGSASAGSDYQSASGTLTFNPGQTTQPISVTINGDISFESNETFQLNLANPVNSTIADAQGVGTILNDDAQGGFISFSQPAYSVGESGGSITITVNRGNDISGPASVDYATSDSVGPVVPCATINGIASSRCDFTTAVGTLRFAAGEGSKTFVVLISQDNYVEGPESLTLTLSNPTGGALFATPSTATLTITDDASEPPANPINDAEVFVRQHYHDFLNREPDAAGLAFWSNQITECQQPGATCSVEIRRINVSAAFFLSIEFQETGYLVERIYKSAYGEASGTSNFGPTHQLPVPVVRFSEFLPDTQQIGLGVVVGEGDWQTRLENNKVAFTQDFVTRARFVSAYPTTLTAAEYVDGLFSKAGVTPSAAERSSIIGEFGGAGTSAETAARARALRRVAEHSTLKQLETNKAFVLMQYFGYLRRDPNDAPDADYTGYDFWLTKLNEFNGNFVNAEMVKAFIVSGEYRQRYGPN